MFPPRLPTLCPTVEEGWPSNCPKWFSHQHHTFRRQSRADTYSFSSALDSSLKAIPLEGLEYFEVVSELTLVPPIVRTDAANYTCEVESHFVQNHSVISANITVKVFGELLLLLS